MTDNPPLLIAGVVLIWGLVTLVGVAFLRGRLHTP